MSILRRPGPALVLILAVLAACSSDPARKVGGADGSRSTATSTSTTVPDPAPFAERGPYAAGVVDLALDDGRRVVVWYPADQKMAAEGPKETFDIASLLSPELQALIPADKRPQYEIDAHPGAAPAADRQARDERFPVVLFSHGFAGFPEQSANLTTHLASWGFVVVAPDHVERSLDGLLGIAAKGVAKRTDLEVLSAALDLATTEAKRAGSPLRSIVDTSRVAVLGHSAGAGAAYRLASIDDRVDAFISYSVGAGGGNGQAPPPVPDVPGMVMLGTTDGITPAETSRKVYAAMKGPKVKVEIKGAGHLVFSDLCLIAKDQGGVIGLAHSINLPIPARFDRLGTDGCKPGDLDPTKAFGAIDDLSVAFLRARLRGDDPGPTLGPEAAKAFPAAGVTVTSEP